MIHLGISAYRGVMFGLGTGKAVEISLCVPVAMYMSHRGVPDGGGSPAGTPLGRACWGLCESEERVRWMC